MSTFAKCGKDVVEMKDRILKQFDSHKSLVDLGVTVDLLFAHAEVDEDGMPKGDALKHHGVKALGIAKILSLKHRVAGRADAEITLDGDWWNDAPQDQRDALLDHELHHLTVKTDGKMKPTYDDIGRPKLRMRPHDYDFGWFNIIAVRHGLASNEVRQAAQLMDGAGQYYWPQLGSKARKQLEASNHPDHVRTDITVGGETFKDVDLEKAARKLGKKAGK